MLLRTESIAAYFHSFPVHYPLRYNLQCLFCKRYYDLLSHLCRSVYFTAYTFAISHGNAF